MADQIEAIPGTVYLVDAQGSMDSQHAKGAEHDIVLVPAPYVLVFGICSSALYSTLGPLSESTGLSYNDLNSGTGYMFLFFGWGCIIWQAIAIQYGKRPVYLLTTLGPLGVMVWQPHVKSNGEWIATKILQGIFGAPIESLAEITVSDVVFTHERGKFIALFMLSHLATATASLRSSWASSMTARDINGSLNHIEGQTVSTSNHTSTDPDTKDDLDTKHDVEQDQVATTTLANVSAPNEIFDLGNTEMSKKSRMSRLKPIERKNLKGENRLIKLISRPILLLAFPIISYAGFIYGCNIVWLSVLNATESMVLSNKPYNMPTSTVGLTFIAPLIGTTLAVTPWVVNLGYQNAFILGAFAGLAHNLTIFPVMKWGRALRQRSAEKYWNTVKEGADLDLNH
ncbi:major facilitator superfamily transporter, putative substrate-H+ antiporter [Fusarium bulbicola]|nr:major facilitator superfamily transporter, putative substrate-H+ antiporter [Fusarium bulbicola]